jgi:hypothetical protein
MASLAAKETELREQVAQVFTLFTGQARDNVEIFRLSEEDRERADAAVPQIDGAQSLMG